MLTKKSKNNPMLMEARKVLLNQVVLDADGHFLTTNEVRFPLWGAADGESKLRVWGLTSREYNYSSELSNTKTLFKVENLMGTIGRLINLRCDNQAAACLVKSYVFYPVVLVFHEDEEEKLVLSAFSPRSLTSALAVRLAVLKFDKTVDGLVDRLEAKRDITARLDEFRNRPKGEKVSFFSKKKKKMEDVEDFFAEGFDSEEKVNPIDIEEDYGAKLTFSEKMMARKAERERRKREREEAKAAEEEVLTFDDIANMDWSVDQFDAEATKDAEDTNNTEDSEE